MVCGDFWCRVIIFKSHPSDANSDIKSLNKEKEISDDEMHQSEDEIQKITDTYVKQVEEILAIKEKELMEI